MDAASLKLTKKHRFFPFIAVFFLFLVCLQVEGAPPLFRTDTPISYFTNVAAHLLRTQLDLDLNRIQIYPKNQYNPAVHRLLQVAANLYDGTTNRTLTPYPYLPSVFRPLFTNDNGVVYIAGYVEATDSTLLSAPMRDLSDPADRAALIAQDMVYGVPIVVGARKGLPNFNEFSMETSVSVVRKLQFLAAMPRDPKFMRPFETNQMYVLTVSNVFGIEGWNAYSNAYPRPLRLIVGTDITTVITNELGTMLLTNRFAAATDQIIPAYVWGGFIDAIHNSNSFQIPFSPSTSHFLSLPNSTYSHATDSLSPLTDIFETNQKPPFAVPRWWLLLNTRLRFFLVDTAANRIVDYVNLVSADPEIDITTDLAQGAGCSATYNPPSQGNVPNGMLWCTNRDTPFGPTFGERLQIDVSLGLFAGDGRQSQPNFPGTGQSALFAAIDFFPQQLLWFSTKVRTIHGISDQCFLLPFQSRSHTLYYHLVASH